MKISRKQIAGGIDGIVSIVCESIKCIDRPMIKKQILKSDDIVIDGLENFDVMNLATIIRYIANGVFDYGDSDYIDETLKGEIYLFGGGDTHQEKSQIFINSSSLQSDEKKILIEKIKESVFRFSLCEIFNSIFVESYPDFFDIIQFVSDSKLEKEYRLSELSKTLDELHRSIDKNSEIIKSKFPKHIEICAKIANKSYNKCLQEIEKNLSAYTNLLGNKLYGIEVTHNHREDIIKNLCDPSKIDTFLEYEQKIALRGYISENFSSWNKKPIDLVKFYRFCEGRKVIHYRHKTKKSGIKLLRELYNYYEGLSIDEPNKQEARTKMPDINATFYFLEK